MGDRCGIGFLVLNFDPCFKRNLEKKVLGYSKLRGRRHQGIVYAGQIGRIMIYKTKNHLLCHSYLNIFKSFPVPTKKKHGNSRPSIQYWTLVLLQEDLKAVRERYGERREKDF